MNNYSCVYLLKEREFIKTNEDVFKVGYSNQVNLKRFNQYPKDSQLICHLYTENGKLYEKKIINVFKIFFKHRKDIGNEFFEGNYKKMRYLMFNIIDKFDDTLNNDENYKNIQNILNNDENKKEIEAELKKEEEKIQAELKKKEEKIQNKLKKEEEKIQTKLKKKEEKQKKLEQKKEEQQKDRIQKMEENKRNREEIILQKIKDDKIKKELLKSPIEQWLCDFINKNIDKDIITYKSSDIYNFFIEWCKINNPDYKITSIQFAVRLKQLNIKGIEKGQHTKKGETKNFNINELKIHFNI
jgi:hypothetical protein